MWRRRQLLPSSAARVVPSSSSRRPPPPRAHAASSPGAAREDAVAKRSPLAKGDTRPLLLAPRAARPRWRGRRAPAVVASLRVGYPDCLRPPPACARPRTHQCLSTKQLAYLVVIKRRLYSLEGSQQQCSRQCFFVGLRKRAAAAGRVRTLGAPHHGGAPPAHEVKEGSIPNIKCSVLLCVRRTPFSAQQQGQVFRAHVGRVLLGEALTAAPRACMRDK